MTRTTFPEAALVRLPAGTLSLLREKAASEGTTPADLMRRAIVQTVAAKAPAKRRTP